MPQMQRSIRTHTVGDDATLIALGENECRSPPYAGVEVGQRDRPVDVVAADPHEVGPGEYVGRFGSDVADRLARHELPDEALPADGDDRLA